MLKRILAGLSVAVACSASSVADAEDWSKFNACVRENLGAVEQAEPSVLDGARVIVDVLCSDVAAELGNQMTREPARQDVVKQNGFVGAFVSFQAVMRRKVTAELFKARKRRLGL